MKSSWEFQPMVDKGCKLLDERLGPEWVEKIDLEQLNLYSSCTCVLGQTSIDLVGRVGAYGAAAETLFPSLVSDPFGPLGVDATEAHGFCLLDGGTPGEYLALTECWRNTILSRRAES